MLPELTTEPTPVAVADSLAGQTGLEAFIRTRLANGSEELFDEAHREFDRIMLPIVMEHTRGNQFQAAKILGVARQTLRRRLHDLNITPRFTDASEPDPE